MEERDEALREEWAQEEWVQTAGKVGEAAAQEHLVRGISHKVNGWVRAAEVV